MSRLFPSICPDSDPDERESSCSSSSFSDIDRDTDSEEQMSLDDWYTTKAARDPRIRNAFRFPSGNICFICRTAWGHASPRGPKAEIGCTVRQYLPFRPHAEVPVHRKCREYIRRKIKWRRKLLQTDRKRRCMAELAWYIDRYASAHAFNEREQLLKLALKVSQQVLKASDKGELDAMGVEHSVISGYADQFRLDSTKISASADKRLPNPRFQKLSDRMRAHAIELLKACGIELDDDVVVADMSLLQVHPESSPQLLHRDGLKSDNVGCILYLSDGWSTEFPILEYESMSERARLSDAQQKYAYRRGGVYYNPLHIVRYHVKQGDLSVFREDIVHRGPGNQSKTPRLALFIKLAKTVEDDPQQQFATHYWNYVLGDNNVRTINIAESLRDTDPHFTSEILDEEKQEREEARAKRARAKEAAQERKKLKQSDQ